MFVSIIGLFLLKKRAIVDIEAGSNRLYSQGNVRQMKKIKNFFKKKGMYGYGLRKN